MLTMFDSIQVSAIPKDAKAVAGYVGGSWPTYRTLVKEFPHAHVLSIAVASTQDAECLDVEAGDATNETAKRWMKRTLARGVKRPVLYTSVSNARALIAAMASVGVKREQFRLWTAHYTQKAHLCNRACGFGELQADATQWTSRGLGRSLDVSLCSDSFFGPPKPPPPPPKPKPKPVKPYKVKITNKDGTTNWQNVGRIGVLFIVNRYLSGKFADIDIQRN